MIDEKSGVKDEEVQPQEESPTTEETTEEVKDPELSDQSDKPQAKTETVGEQQGKGANARIRELNQAKKAAEEKATKAEEKAQSLAQRLAEITDPLGSSGQEVPQFNPQVEPGQEITPEQYQSDVGKTADAIVELRIRQNNAVNRIQNESEGAIRKYSQLDPDSDDFDKELSDTVTEATEAYVRQSPYSASVSKFVDKLMKPYLGSVAKEVGKQTENITKQVSEAALRPTSIRSGEKSAKDKSIAELEDELGIIQA